MAARPPHGDAHRIGIAVGAPAAVGCAARLGEHCAPTAALPARFIHVVIADVVVRFGAGTDAALLQLVLHGLRHMIGLPAGTKIWSFASITDMRAAMNGLAAKSKLRWPQIRVAAMRSYSVDGAAICSRYFGGPALACVC